MSEAIVIALLAGAAAILAGGLVAHGLHDLAEAHRRKPALQVSVTGRPPPEVERLIDVAHEARKLFFEYALRHVFKPEGADLEKATRNADMAHKLDEALAAIAGRGEE
jgi:hypothetical protein